MEDSKALSPEAKGLFETVRSQAKEYENAFELLDYEIKELQIQREMYINSAEQLRADVNNAILELSKNVEDTLSNIDSKTNKAIKIYDELDNIRQLKNSLTLLSEALKKQELEFETSLQSFKARSDLEIETALANLNNTIEKEIDNEAQKIEVRMALALKQVQTKLLNYDQRIWSLSDMQTRDFKNFNEEISILKSRITNLTVEMENLRKFTETKTSELANKHFEYTPFDLATPLIENNLSEDLDEFQKKQHKISKDELIRKESKITHEVFHENIQPGYQMISAPEPAPLENLIPPEIKDYSDDIKKLKQRITIISTSFTDNQKKGNISLILACVSLLGFIILLILTFVK